MGIYVKKIAIVTGASSGMGKWFAAFSKAFFTDIDEIWLIARNMRRLARVSTQVNCNSVLLALDLTISEDFDSFAGMLREEHPSISLLVNCAGMGVIGRFDEQSYKDDVNMISLNCMALTNVTRLCLPYMNKNSHIINLASAAAFVAQPEFAVYAASKSYVLSFSEALGEELRHQKIYVTAVCPGCVKTPFFTTAEKYTRVKPYKKLFMADEKAVVLLALWDAKKNKPYSIYGPAMKLLRIATKVLPARLLMRFM